MGSSMNVFDWMRSCLNNLEVIEFVIKLVISPGSKVNKNSNICP